MKNWNKEHSQERALEKEEYRSSEGPGKRDPDKIKPHKNEGPENKIDKESRNLTENLTNGGGCHQVREKGTLRTLGNKEQNKEVEQKIPNILYRHRKGHSPVFDIYIIYKQTRCILKKNCYGCTHFAWPIHK